MSEPDLERRDDLDRLLTFVDAIVAIAITLLVLPLAELAADVSADESVWRLLREHSDQLGAFVLSFVVIARLWLAQHRLVRSAVEMRTSLSMSLIAWTLTIVFLPFPTELLAHAGGQAATKVLYIGTLALSSVLLTLVATAVRAQRPPAAPTASLIPGLLSAALFVVALALSLAVPPLGYYPLLLVAADGPLARLAARRVSR